MRNLLSWFCWLQTRAGRYISGVNAPYVPLNAHTPANLSGSTDALWLTRPMARRHVARFLDRGLEPRAERVGLGIVVAPDAAVLEVDRLRQVRGQRQRAVVR